MTCLADPSLWLERAPCVQKHPKLARSQAAPKAKATSKKPDLCCCLTPYGFCSHASGIGQRCFHVASAGTTCVDVSRFGSMAGLMGQSCEALSVWLSELALTRPVTCLELSAASGGGASDLVAVVSLMSRHEPPIPGSGGPRMHGGVQPPCFREISTTVRCVATCH